MQDLQEAFTQVETAATPSSGELSGEQELALAFGGDQTETPPPPEDTPPATEEPGEAGDESLQPPAPQEPTPDPKELTEEYIQARVREQVEAAQREQLTRAQQEEFSKRLSQLSDADYGAYMRQHQQTIAQYQSAQEAALVHFYKESTTDVLSHVAELKTLSPEEAAAINPKGAKSYADLVGKMVDVAAAKRAEKLAKPTAEKMFQAWKATEQAKLAKHASTITEMSGGATASRAGLDLDLETSSGREILTAAFSDKG